MHREFTQADCIKKLAAKVDNEGEKMQVYRKHQSTEKLYLIPIHNRQAAETEE